MILKRERIELRNIVQNAVEAAGPLIEARKHRLTTTLPPQPVYLNADGTRLAQVFLNLLNNAAKFTEVGGNITFEAAVKGPELVITVADSGIGIPLEMLPVIFDMFAQVDHSLERTQAGLGVGLTLSQHLTELHGGTILAHSDGRGQGSQFIIRLPVLSDDIEEPVAGDLDAGGTHPAGHRILLADDNVDFAVSLCLLLEMLGHQVQVTHDGEEALKAFAAFKPDFAFLDIGLPKINGYDLVRRMRGLSAAGHCVFVAITGWGQEEDRRRAREAGFDHHLVKPVEPEQIRTILRKFSPADKATV
jgi:CheY-like chemotaxis protein